MPVYEDGQARMGCCGTLSPAPNGATYHDPGCPMRKYIQGGAYQRRAGGTGKHLFNAKGYERWRIVPCPAQPSPDLPTWTGWVAPDGRFFSCDYAGHTYMATRLKAAGLLGVPQGADPLTLKKWELYDGQSRAVRLGWIETKGYTPAEIVNDHMSSAFIWLEDGKPTQKQLDTLFDLARKHGTMKTYEDFLLIHGD